MATDISEALRRLVADRAYHVCEYCLAHEDDLSHTCEVDHVVSTKHGGKSTAENLARLIFDHARRAGFPVETAS